MTSAEHEKMPVEEEAAAAFFQPLQGEWTQGDRDAHDARLSADTGYAAAYVQVEKVWAALATHAESPQLLARRQEAIAYARRESARRWLRTSPYTRTPWRTAAVLAAMTLVSGVIWQLSPFGYHPGRYHTGIGEQRMVELDDHSHIDLDAATTLEVRYTKDARIIDLKQGQAQFSVAKDPIRPFRVVVGGRTIVALGTVFTVDFTGQQLRVAMVDGRVAVVADESALGQFAPQTRLSSSSEGEQQAVNGSPTRNSSRSIPAQESNSAAAREDGTAADSTIELSVGEELKVGRDGHATVIPKADLEAATAWLEHKVIFHTEALGEAVQRLNRYSRVQIEIADPSLATEEISGVFEAGDAQGFVRDVQRYLPIVAESLDSGRIRLRIR